MRTRYVISLSKNLIALYDLKIQLRFFYNLGLFSRPYVTVSFFQLINNCPFKIFWFLKNFLDNIFSTI